MRALARTLALAAAALAPGGCETADVFGLGGDAALPCPGVSMLADAGAFSRLADGSAPGAETDPAEVAFEARIAGFEALCEYADADDPAGGMTLAVTVFLAAERDPAIGAAAGGRVPWFVAAVSPDGTVASKREFAAAFAFEEPGGAIASAAPGEVELRFPAGAARAPWEYDIAIGFQLDRAQLEFQRARRR